MDAEPTMNLSNSDNPNITNIYDTTTNATNQVSNINQAGDTSHTGPCNQVGRASQAANTNKIDSNNQVGVNQINYIRLYEVGGWDPRTNTFVIEDYNGIRARGFNPNVTSQPYARRLSNALDGDWSRNHNHRILSIQQTDKDFFCQVCVHKDGGRNSYKMYNNTMAMRSYLSNLSYVFIKTYFIIYFFNNLTV